MKHIGIGLILVAVLIIVIVSVSNNSVEPEINQTSVIAVSGGAGGTDDTVSILCIEGYVRNPDGSLTCIPLPSAPILPSDVAPTSVVRDINEFCSDKFPNGDLTMDLDFDDVEENGHCFPVKYLDVIKFEQRITFEGIGEFFEGTSEILDITIADINFRNSQIILDDDGRIDVVGDVHKFGIITDANGVAFIELHCLVDTEWAFCQDRIGASYTSPLNSLLSFFNIP